MTLVEAMISASLGAIVALGTISAMVIVQRGTLETFWLNESSRQSRIIADLVAKDLRGAIEIESAFDTFTAGDDTIILKVPSIDSDENIIDLDTTFDRIIYHPGGDSSVIVREVHPDANSSRIETHEVIGNIVSEPTYQGTFATHPNALGAYVVHYQFTASKTIRGKTFKVPVSGSVRLRNKP
jgi:hypothetical protein